MTLAQEAANPNTSQQRLRELATLSTELARLVANNSNADGELLKDLRVTSDYITRNNLAQNPNTPQEVLIKLAWQLPQEVKILVLQQQPKKRYYKMKIFMYVMLLQEQTWCFHNHKLVRDATSFVTTLKFFHGVTHPTSVSSASLW